MTLVDTTDTIRALREQAAATDDPDEIAAIVAVLHESLLAAPSDRAGYEYRLVLDQLDLELAGYEAWLHTIYPMHFTAGFAHHHRQMWEWTWSIRRGATCRPFAAIWNRGAAKSTGAELSVIATGARQTRRYWLYVCDTQERANSHVATLSSAFESDELERRYPEFSRRLISKYGYSRGWTQNRLRTESGFTVDAIGLDKAVRGVKLEEQRPDAIILDDIDRPADTENATRKKVSTITRDILPAGSPDCVVFAVQNLVHPTGVFARIAGLVPRDDPFAVVLPGAELSGPIAAIDDMVIDEEPDETFTGGLRARIVAGTPTWPEHLGIDALQAELDEIGETAFRMEYQHEVDRLEGAMYEQALRRVRRHVCAGIDEMHALLTDMVRVAVWCDPAVTDTDASDSQGLQADALAPDGVIWRLRSWERRASPAVAIMQGIGWCYELGAGVLGIETDQGGDTWGPQFREALAQYLDENPERTVCSCGHMPAEHHEDECHAVLDDGAPCKCEHYEVGRPPPGMIDAKAGREQVPKAERSQRMLADYESPGPPIVHVYGYPDDSRALDAALGRVFVRKPFDLADAAYWSWTDLRIAGQGGTGLATARGIRRRSR